ncbi:hypothetical protein CAC42_2031 [Sphaceloma murrayae]|uniref:Uncharacterized protein n=1 Tax=Sphaceloma murrayae TaxID=2082308 RepID=A0A2K1QIS5_9PEZI|nr:hypothetical protein CAC42_2031 [Sphaceloma murrayae]
MSRRSTRLTAPPTSSRPPKRRTNPSASGPDLETTPRAAKAAKRGPRVGADDVSTPTTKPSVAGATIVSRGRRATPRESQHFTGREYDDATGLTSTEEEGGEDSESEFGEGGEGEGEGSDEEEEEGEGEGEEDVSSAEEGKRGGRAGRGAKGKGRGGGLPSRARGDAVERGDVLPEPGTEVVIKKPKARGPGKVPYEDGRVHSNTMLFLEELRDNNQREWMKMHDPDYRQAEKDWKSFIEVLTEKLTEVDDEIPELPVKDIVFRIYRDIRFSPDPTPYKPYFSAAWSRTGRKGPYAAYYLQIKPGGDSFLGGGSWFPESQPLSRLRTDIDRRPQRFKSILMDDRLRKEFLGGATRNEKKVVQAFTSAKMNKESALKTRPQGYAKDHADIDLLRLKNFTIGRQLEDEEVVGAGFLEKVVDLVGVMKPFIHYLNSVVMPDPDADDDEDEDEDDGDGDGDEDGQDSGSQSSER